MNIEQVADELIRSASGGNNTADNKFDAPYVKSIVPVVRAKAITLRYYGGQLAASREIIKGTGKIHPLWLQSFTVNIVSSVQDLTSDHLVFSVPAQVTIGTGNDGSVYLGEKKNANNFYQLQNAEEMSTYKKRGWINGQRIAYYSEGDTVEIYGNMSLKSIYVRRILNDPAKAPNFVMSNDYPISDDLLPVMIDVFRVMMNNLPKDLINDGVPILDRRQNVL